jgi:hypothetical protein
VKDVEYEVRVEGFPTEAWPQWFPGVHMERLLEPDGSTSTVLRLHGRDVSLLHGVLAQIGALNATLVSVRRREGEDYEDRRSDRQSP